MTEAEWLACADPTPMLEFLRGKASDRKLRLFAIAVVRLRRSGLRNARVRLVFWAAESLADGLLDSKVAERMANDLFGFPQSVRIPLYWLGRVGALCRYESQDLAEQATGWKEMIDYTSTKCDIFRDIFGFQPLPPPSPAVLAWNDRTIPRLAQAIYDDRKLPEGTFDTARLAILADALLDAGCEDEDLIAHCRIDGPHVRGCWAVDLCLGKS
jgi:hypothetical protein